MALAQLIVFLINYAIASWKSKSAKGYRHSLKLSSTYIIYTQEHSWQYRGAGLNCSWARSVLWARQMEHNLLLGLAAHDSRKWGTD